MPKPPPPQNSSPSPTTLAKSHLQTLTQLLHLTHHRNKNQHRLTKWYKQFSILRRNISKLLLEVEALETAEKFSSVGSGKGEKYVRDAREVVERRVEFLEVRVLERVFVAFSTVVKDLQYANLGLMLMGMLARVKSVIRPLGKEKVEEEEEEELSGRSELDVDASVGDQEMQDLGEVVRRDEVESSIPDADHGEEEVDVGLKTPKTGMLEVEEKKASDNEVESRPKKRSKEEKKKKKRKRGDAFDDLFDSLI